jgi:hypothetical protein
MLQPDRKLASLGGSIQSDGDAAGGENSVVTSHILYGVAKNQRSAITYR